MTISPAALLILLSAAVSAAPPLSVDGARLNASMAEMKAFGATPDGASARVAYSEANRAALDHVAGLMTAAGLTARIDVAGNLVGRREGSVPGLAPLMAGSHIDTVPNGGHYDGVVGVMGAIEVARALHDAGVSLRHPLEIVVWTNEEGGKNGSRALNGSVTAAEFDLPSLGERSIGDGIRFLGGDPDRLADARRTPGEIAAYVELHVEQGAILHRDAVEIGVVEGIVGIRRWNVTIEGFANHAGTTPMDQRQDALVAAAQFVTTLRNIIADEPGRQVGTVGRLQVHPGAPNVIPGLVTLSVEIRDLDMGKIERLFDRIRAAGEALGAATGTRFSFEQFYESPAALTDQRLQDLVEDAATSLGLTSLRLPSGAGHDAQSLAPLCPIGMIFVPSVDGVSHSPLEFTSPAAITNGANVLLQMLLALDRLPD